MSGTTKTDPIAEILAIVRATQQGLGLMLETQAIHSEQLEKLMETATKKPGPSPLHDAVERVVSELEKQGETLHRIENGITTLMTREVEAEEPKADADGVIAVLGRREGGQDETANGQAKDGH